MTRQYWLLYWFLGIILHITKENGENMRKAEGSIEEARQVVERYFGKEVAIKYNRGRNKICHYKGKITQAYSNVFVITIYNEIFDRLSCSYTDILCGEVSFKELQ